LYYFLRGATAGSAEGVGGFVAELAPLDFIIASTGIGCGVGSGLSASIKSSFTKGTMMLVG
jgi:hypothetical protein